MEDLYGDLENYNEVNAVQELRIENKDLKLKLEEYETAMEKLQKSLFQDYDNLSMEFHNLQTNYSSLLKTARAEVERKSKMITLLNHEKDEMILQAARGKSKTNYYNRNKFPKALPNTKTSTTVDTHQVKSDKKVMNEHTKKSSDVKKERGVLPPKSENTKLLNTENKLVEKVDLSIKGELRKVSSHDTSECKDAPKIIANSIKNRRKSMPAVSLPLHSSEEDEPKKPTTSVRNIIPSTEMTETRNINMNLKRISHESGSLKLPELSTVDGKSYNYQEQIREGYRGRISRQENDKPRMHDRFRDNDRLRDSDKYREEDKFREGDKYRDSDKYRGDFKYTEGNKFRQFDKYREGDRRGQNEKYVASDKYKESDNFGGLDRYREGNKYKEGDRHREGFRGGDKYRECDKFKDNGKYKDRKRYSPDRPPKRPYREYQNEYNRHEYGKHRILESPSPEANSYFLHNHKSQEHAQWPNFDRHSQESDKYKSPYEDRHSKKHLKPHDYDEPSSKRQKFEPGKQQDEIRNYDNKPTARLSRPEAYEFDILGSSCQSPDAAFSPDTQQDATIVHTIKEIKNTAVTPLEDPRVTSKKYVLKAEHGKTTLATTVSKSIDIKPVDKSLWNIQSVAVPDALLNKPPLQTNNVNIKDIYMNIDDNPEVSISMELGEMYSNLEDNVSDSHNKPEEAENAKQNNELNKHPAKVLVTQETQPVHTREVTTTYKIPKVKQNNETNVPNMNTVVPKIISEDHTTNNVSIESPSSIITQSLPHIDLPHSHDILLPTNIVDSKTYRSEECKQNRITLSDMAMVQDDLELSDETSDNVDLHKETVTGKEIGNKIKPTSAPKIDVLEIKNNSKALPKENVNADIINIALNQKPKETDGHKKQKSKRRKTKSKEKELIENTDVIHSTEKRTRSKKDKESKPTHIKNKFTDLFGDSSSLITPEDLGIPATCVPLCEDAQDAVDVNIKDKINATRAAADLYVPLPSANRKEISNYGHNEESTYDTNVTNPNTADKEIAKRIEEQIASPIIDANVYQNLNSEADKPDVVKTVVISSGVQPQFALNEKNDTKESHVAVAAVNTQNVVDCNQFPAIMGLKNQNPIKALATSTPHKEFSVVKALETDSRSVDCVSNCNDSNSESVDIIGTSVNNSDTNTPKSHDAPDVRIFVRRRRKGVKKT